MSVYVFVHDINYLAYSKKHCKLISSLHLRGSKRTCENCFLWVGVIKCLFFLVSRTKRNKSRISQSNYSESSSQK